MIKFENACLSFGNQTIFDSLSYAINETDRVGLVGDNGTGKSTFLRIIAGQQKLDSGNLERQSYTKIGYMPQELTLTSNKSIIDEAIAACEYDETNEQALRAQAKKILTGLGFTLAQCDQPVNSLSVGWKMRLLLGQLLLQNADFYLFDEPTNHLDIVAQEWFLNFLKTAPFGFVIVCHDRYFLDQLCTTIYELENGKGTKYRGNYSQYQDQKEQQLTILYASYKNQQRDIARKEKTIERFRAQASRARMVKKMERDLDKIERIELPSAVKTIHFAFPPVKPSGKVVLDVQNAQFSFAQKPVFKNVSFTILRGERVAVIAPNGFGKTTLFNVISGEYKLQHGIAQLGHNVTRAYFKQDQLQALNPDKTVFETAYDSAPKIHPQEIKNLLGCFLFSDELINKKTAVLSGGEKNRVCMINTLLQQANFLLLDEPTNHLDIKSKDILLRALQAYEGTVLFVSHDHGFVNGLATSIIELTSNGAYKYDGTYEQYLAQKQARQEQEIHGRSVPAPMELREALPGNPVRPEFRGPNALKSSHPSSRTSKETNGNSRELKKIENLIKTLENKIFQINTELEHLSYGTPEFNQALQKLQTTQKALDDAQKSWEELYS